MTCIAAIAHDGLVTLGGDSATVSGTGSQLIRDAGKVVAFGEFVAGASGFSRVADLLRHSYRPKPARMKPARFDLDAYMAVEFASGMRDFMKKAGALGLEDGMDSMGEHASALIGVRGRIFVIGSTFACIPIKSSCYAIGAGGDIAFGSLMTTQDNPELGIEERLTIALEIAARWTEGVAPPFTFVTTKRKKGKAGHV